MADTIMTETKPERAPSPGDVCFDGMVLDLDRVLAFVSIQFLLHPSAFVDDSSKVAYLLAHFRGPALDWAGRQIASSRPADVARFSNYASMLAHVRATFGYEASQVSAMCQTRMSACKQTGDLLEFITEFEGLCQQIGLMADVTKITLLLPKLTPHFRNALTMSGENLSDYSTMRNQLFNVYARSGVQEGSTEGQRAKARCKKCGKRGHSASQCVAKN